MTALPPIQYKTLIAAPPSRVFEILTTAAGWDGWFTAGASMDARVGGALTMRWKGARESRHRVTLWGPEHGEAEFACSIVALEPDRVFAFRWQSASAPTTVEFRLTPRGDGTVVDLADSGWSTEDLGTVGPTGAITGASPYTMCASGWGEALALLKMFIEHGITYGQIPASEGTGS